MEATSYALIALGVISLVLAVWALVDLWRSPYSMGMKIAWTFGIVIIPIIASVLYLLSRPGGRLQKKTYELPTAEELEEDYRRRQGGR